MSIFHYTDLHGLLGIVSNNELWATNINFLNDSEESVHGCKCFRNTISQASEEIIPENQKPALLKAIDNYERGKASRYDSVEKHVYSISFCKGEDKLSQWRGYGNKQGVCIEFDKDELIKFVQNEFLTCVAKDVVYTSEKNTVEMSKGLVDFFNSNEIDLVKIRDSFILIASTYNHLAKIIPFFKNDSFTEEDEFRLVFTPWMNLPEVHFRVNENGLIPYIILKGTGKENLPIKSITIGPTKDYSFVEAGVKMLLMNKGYDKVAINPSKVPYRG
ncbi:DUF2971 domain-containing protein [Klebsiella aerogenes]|uniref:DUF2971 domain-containing protein n=1 Tax=Klebsiella aerogenes TaxID=548 RepID=UPI002E343D71|nr:DUF2971 domain-containing protein [Klebsiella aerogenes]